MCEGKRGAEGGGASTGNDEQEVTDQQIPARSIHVVVSTWDARPVYSVYRVDHPYVSAPKKRRRRRLLQPVATLEVEAGKAFVSVHTRRRKWILAVGGLRPTVVFDADTGEVVHGPSLLNAKDRPVLAAVGDKVYALSRFPKVRGSRDFEPWFEVLDLSQARVVDGRLVDCAWEELPSPPCFPCHLAVHDFFSPPVVIVHSYAVVGSYILLSPRSNRQATYAFDTISAKWHSVHGGKSLPFIGRPTPQQQQQHDHAAAGLYLGESAQGNDRWSSLARQGDPAVISAYAIKLSAFDKEDGISLSVTEFPVRSSETSHVTGIHYSSLDKGVFCSLGWKSRKRIRPSSDDDILADEIHFSKKATITLKTYQMEDSSLLQEEEETLPVKKITISEQTEEQAFKIRTKSEGFICPAFLTVFST